MAAAKAGVAEGVGVADVPTDAQRADALEERLAALQEELEKTRAAAARPDASGADGGAVVEVLVELASELRAAREVREEEAKAKAPTFGSGETPQDVWKSLEGSNDESLIGEKMPMPLRFKARGKNLVILHKARHRYHDPSGNLVVTQGRRYDFAPNGELITEDSGVAEYLKQRPMYGSEFWLVGEEPFKVPEAGAVIDSIMEATMRMDVSALDAIEHEERDGYKRPAVLEGVAAARRSIARAGETE